MARARGTTTEEILSVNGVVLNTYAKNIESLTGRLRTPGKRTANIVVPGKHGTQRTGGKKFDENVIPLPMWVVGSDDDGRIPTGQTERKLFFKNVDALSHLFLGTDGPLDVRHTLPDKTIRQCFADVLDALDFTTNTAHPIGKFGVSLVVWDAFWQDLNPVTQEKAANGGTAEFDSFRGATAPMEDLKLHVTGPWITPRLTFSDGSWVEYDDEIPGGVTFTVDSSSWSLSRSDGESTPLEKLRYRGTSSRWAAVPAPGVSASVVVTLGGTSRTSDSKLALEGRRKYLVG